MRGVEAVIFDMDGTLVDSESVSLRAWRAAARDMGFELSEGLIRPLVGRNAQAAQGMALSLFDGDRASADEFIARHLAHFDRLTRDGFELMPGAVEALEALSAEGLPLAVATSTVRARAVPRLECTGLDGYFASVTCGDEVERGKPEPDIFLMAAARLGVDPSRAAVVEDSPNGVRAGHAAGARVLMVPDMIAPPDEIAAMCAEVLEGLHGLPDAVARLRVPA